MSTEKTKKKFIEKVDASTKIVSNLILRLFVFSLLILSIKIVIEDYFDTVYYIDPIIVPKSMEQNGYNGYVTALKLIDKINYIQEYPKSSKSLEQYVIRGKSSALTLKVAGGQFTYDNLINFIKKRFGRKDKVLSGEILKENNKLVLNLRTDNKLIKTIEVDSSYNNNQLKYNKFDDLIFEGSAYLLEKNSPINLSLYHYRKREFTKAFNLVEYQDDEWSCIVRGLIYRRRDKNYNRALEEFEKAIEIGGRTPEVHNSRGNCFRDKNLYEEAIKEYTKAIELKDDFLMGHNNIAYTLHLQKDYHPSIRKANEILKMNNSFGHSYSVLAQNYSMLNNRQQFWKNLKLALENGAPVWFWLHNPAYAKWKDNEDFQNLLNFYKKKSQ